MYPRKLQTIWNSFVISTALWARRKEEYDIVKQY